MNRGNGRAEVFHKPDDYEAFVQLFALANARLPMRLLDWRCNAPSVPAADTARRKSSMSPRLFDLNLLVAGQLSKNVVWYENPGRSGTPVPQP